MKLHVLTLSLLAVLGLSALTGHPSETEAAPAASAAQNPHGGGQPLSLWSLRGRHGFSYSGFVAGMRPVASSGSIHFDGHGDLSAVFTTSVDGTTFTGSFTGTYAVNPDGTGSVVIDLPFLGMQAHGDFVIVDRGDGTFFTSTDMGYSVTGSTRMM